jgi:hypothetical protein
MEHVIENRELIPNKLAWFAGAVACLFVFFYVLTIIGGSWTLWVDCSQVAISMRISLFHDSFLEVRLKHGSHSTKEKMDAQKDHLDIRHNHLRFPFDLRALDGWW